jgi:hypothetical protein
MEPEGSLPSSQELSTYTYPEPDQSSPQQSILSLKGQSQCYQSTYVSVFLVVSSDKLTKNSTQLSVQFQENVSHSESLGFWTLSTLRNSKKNNISETGSVSVLRFRKDKNEVPKPGNTVEEWRLLGCYAVWLL